MPTTRTSEATFVTSGGTTYEGRIWTVTPLMPWSGDTTPEADTYRTRNAGKTRRVRTWLGVPYALPPVGERRWVDAVDLDPMPAGTLDCSKFGNVPHQVYSEENGDTGRPEWGNLNSAASYREIMDGAKESEDCLFLNIYRNDSGTPPPGGFPVLFWIHGGGHTYRSANEPHERGHRLCLEGLIVVNVEYRLGNFGYHHHDDWVGVNDWNGPNFAYTDIRSALRWVKRNIAAFGGNPDKIMVGGSSAGGVHSLNLLGDASMADAFTCAWVSSGGGLGERMAIDPTPAEPEGYRARCRRLQSGHRACADLIRSYDNPAMTLQQLIDAVGEGQAMRLGLSPDLILAMTDRRKRFTFPNQSNMALGPLSERGSENRYPWRGNGLSEKHTLDHIRKGHFTKPFVHLTAENEATMQPGYASWGEGTASNWLRLINVPSYQEWNEQPWIPGGWSATERRRQVYNHVIWHYPAWRTVWENNFRTPANPAYLILNGFSASGGAAHSEDVKFIFGNLEWSVGMSGGEAMVTERILRASAGIMRLIRNMAYNGGDPNTNAPAAGTSFSLFATVPQFTLEAYDRTTGYNRWNVFGHTATLGGGSAPVQMVQQDYLPGAWLYYTTLFG